MEIYQMYCMWGLKAECHCFVEEKKEKLNVRLEHLCSVRGWSLFLGQKVLTRWTKQARHLWNNMIIIVVLFIYCNYTINAKWPFLNKVQHHMTVFIWSPTRDVVKFPTQAHLIPTLTSQRVDGANGSHCFHAGSCRLALTSIESLTKGESLEHWTPFMVLRWFEFHEEIKESLGSPTWSCGPLLMCWIFTTGSENHV